MFDFRRYFLVGFSLFLPAAQLFLFWKGLKIYPYSDEWWFVDVVPGLDVSLFSKWMFALHGEHLIPIQKVFQKVLLSWSGYDFRITVVANMAIASMTCLLLVFSLYRIRGSHSWLDVIVPLFLLNPTAGFSSWGFHFQFLSSIFLVSLMLAVIVSKIKYRCAAVISLAALLPFCGLNGFVLSAIIVPAVAYEGWVCRRERSAVVATFLFVMASIIVFKISAGVAGGHQDVSVFGIGEFLLGLLGASFFAAPVNPVAWLNIFVFTVLLLCGSWFLKLVWNERSLADLQLLSFYAAPIILLVAVAWGRSAHYGGWQPSIAWHYGTLLSVVPIMFWLLVSRFRGYERSRLLVGVSVFLVAVWVHYAALNWRIDFVAANSGKLSAVVHEIASNAITVEEVVQRNLPELFFTAEGTVEGMRKKMPVLRRAYDGRFAAHEVSLGIDRQPVGGKL